MPIGSQPEEACGGRANCLCTCASSFPLKKGASLFRVFHLLSNSPLMIMSGNGEPTNVTNFERSELLRILRISARQLRGWQRAGLIADQDRFSFFDLIQIKKVRDLRAKRVKSATIRASLLAMQIASPYVSNFGLPARPAI